MNQIDKQVVKCIICGSCIGEVDYEADVAFARCKKCIQTDKAEEFYRNLILDYKLPEKRLTALRS